MEGHPKTDEDGLDTSTPPTGAPRGLERARPVDAPRRCFICLTDQDPSDPPGTWVDPCPCTLEAHQDCMLSWVTDCEHSNKPLLCPVCKSKIELEGHWDLVVAASDALHRRFTRISPFVLFTGVSMGVQFSLQLYGALALWTFAGKNSLLRFLMGPDMVIDTTRAGSMALVKDRVWKALAMMNVAPALLFGRLLPNLSNKIFVPAASLVSLPPLTSSSMPRLKADACKYGMYHIMHHDEFVTWPPSPRLAIAAFPYIRSIYYNLWWELVLPYEVKLNRQLAGLPPTEEREAVNRRADGEANVDGGVLGILQGIMDALDPDEPDQPGGHENQDLREQGEIDGNVQGEIMVELQIGQVELEGVVPVDQEPAREVEVEARVHDEPARAAGAAPANAGEQGQGHEALQAPLRRMGIGAFLSNVSNAIVSALILPGISLVMGEALRLVLPSPWTRARAGPAARPGLLQQQWGRSLVGGCLYVVLKDAVRVYAKSRRVAALGSRRVRSVDRRRRGRRGGDDATG